MILILSTVFFLIFMFQFCSSAYNVCIYLSLGISFQFHCKPLFCTPNHNKSRNLHRAHKYPHFWHRNIKIQVSFCVFAAGVLFVLKYGKIRRKRRAHTIAFFSGPWGATEAVENGYGRKHKCKIRLGRILDGILAYFWTSCLSI